MARKKKAEKAMGMERLIELNRKIKSVFAKADAKALENAFTKMDREAIAKALGLTSSEFSKLEETLAKVADLAKELFPELLSKKQSGG